MASPNSKKIIIPITFLVLLLAGLIVFFIFRDTNGPEISITPESGRVSKNTTFTLKLTDNASGLRKLVVDVIQKDTAHPLFEKSFPSGQKSLDEPFTLGQDNTTLGNGDIEIEVHLWDRSFAGFGKGNYTRSVFSYHLDTIAPQITLENGSIYIKQGGTGCVGYSANEKLGRTGVKLQESFFPGFPQANGNYVCFFPFPHDMEPGQFIPLLIATDEAGNERTVKVDCTASKRVFVNDTLELPDSFLESKMPEFESQIPGQMTPLERFIRVNREIREANNARLLDLGSTTAPVPLWEGPFLRMPRTAARAGFGDRRTYLYQGKEIDHQVHMGVDLASTQNAPVPAANSGKVIFSDYLGIYGNLVVIDHGMGLQSLYSHLSEMSVGLNEDVKKGQIIGKSGTTGMAGGDHLHFGMSVFGYPVTPIEWWDAHWLRNNVLDRFGKTIREPVSPSTATQPSPGTEKAPAAKPKTSGNRKSPKTSSRP